MTLEFENSFSLYAPSQTKAKIINPAPDTITACEKKKSNYPAITITAGYTEKSGTCVVGEIIKFTHTPGVDSTLDIEIGDRTSLWSYARINKSWSNSVSARDVASVILSDVGVVASDMIFEVEKIYDKGISFSGTTLRSAMLRIAKDTKSTFSFKNGQASFLSSSGGVITALVLNYTSGLVEAAKSEKGWKVKTLFLHEIQAGSIVVLEKGKEQIKLKVLSGKHQFSPTSAYTEFEAKVL